MLEISPLNPIIFYGVLPYDFEHSWPKCYFQKFETADVTRIQIFSDNSDVSAILKRLATNETVHSFPVVEIPTMLSGFSFMVYESTLDWAAVGEGDYYLEVSSIGDLFTSAPISVRDEFEGTLLFKYRNSENNFSVLFDTEIIFDLRVEGTIQNFSPKADDEIYNDEKRNATKLSSIPYQTFTLFIGGSAGLPDWMTDKVNRIMSCDMIRIGGRRSDGAAVPMDWFEKVEGAEWEVKREVEYPFSGLEIEIMPTNNLFLQRLKFEDENDDDMANTVILRRAENRFGVSGQEIFTGLFKDKTVLIYLRVLRRDLPFMFRVGTTSGGNEIGEFEAVEVCGTYQVRHPFDTTTTVYISGLGVDSDVSIVYEQLDEVGGGDGGVIPPVPANLGVGAIIMYEQPAEQFALDFDLVTGLGRIGTPWQGWAICNGANGTEDTGGKVVVGWQSGSVLYGNIGNTGGSENITINRPNLPDIILRIDVGVENTSQEDGGSGRFVGGSVGFEPIPMNPIYTESLGDGNPIFSMPPYVVFVHVKKIA